MTFTNTRKVRIEWADCDPAGIVFYPRYFEIFDASTSALFERALGMTMFKMFKTFESRRLSAGAHARAFRAADTLRRRRDRRIGNHVRPLKFRRRPSHHQQRPDLRRVLGDARVGRARSGRSRPLQIAPGSGSGAGQVPYLTIVVPAQAGTRTPCPVDRLRSMGPGPRTCALVRDNSPTQPPPRFASGFAKTACGRADR